MVTLRQAEDDVHYVVHRPPRGGGLPQASTSGGRVRRQEGGAGEEEEEDEAELAALRAYLNLGQVSLATLYADFSRRNARFAALAAHLPGCRMLQQEPLECLFSFICSSNNNIARIGGMVQRLCAAYGDRLDAPGAPGGEGEGGPAYYAFPTLAQLAAADEPRLQAEGFGYRAKYVVGAAALLSRKEEERPGWLLSLRLPSVPFADAAAALMELPGVGPKVAACVCLFSLCKHEVVPVDTHMWQLARQHYLPQLQDAK